MILSSFYTSMFRKAGIMEHELTALREKLVAVAAKAKGEVINVEAEIHDAIMHQIQMITLRADAKPPANAPTLKDNGAGQPFPLPQTASLSSLLGYLDGYLKDGFIAIQHSKGWQAMSAVGVIAEDAGHVARTIMTTTLAILGDLAHPEKEWELLEALISGGKAVVTAKTPDEATVAKEAIAHPEVAAQLVSIIRTEPKAAMTLISELKANGVTDADINVLMQGSTSEVQALIAKLDTVPAIRALAAPTAPQQA